MPIRGACYHNTSSRSIGAPVFNGQPSTLNPSGLTRLASHRARGVLHVGCGSATTRRFLAQRWDSRFGRRVRSGRTLAVEACEPGFMPWSTSAGDASLALDETYDGILVNAGVTASLGAGSTR